ncbi:MAG: hypothetical protein ACLQIB_52960 [Isosphaeraceae bacterium]
MRFKLILYLLSPGIAHLVLLVLGAWIEGHRAGGPNKRLVRKRLRRAPGARRVLCWTACGAVALPEPLARRWNGPYLYRNDWETMAALSELVCDDIRNISRCSDREVRMCPRSPTQTRHGQLKWPKWGPKCLN